MLTPFTCGSLKIYKYIFVSKQIPSRLHHRFFTLFLVLTLICQSSGIGTLVSYAANTTSNQSTQQYISDQYTLQQNTSQQNTSQQNTSNQNSTNQNNTQNTTTKSGKIYIYVRTNPIIDDSWIGTLVNIVKQKTPSTSFTGITPNNSQYTVPVSPVTTYLNRYINDIYINDTSLNSAPQNNKNNPPPYVTVAEYVPFQSALLETINALWDKILTHDIAIYTLSGKINTINNTLNTLTNTSLNTTNPNLSTNNNSNTTNPNTTNPNTTNLNATNTNLNTLSGRVTTAETNISNLSGAIAATNTRLNYAG